MFCSFYIALHIYLFQVRHPGEPIPMPKCPISAKRNGP